MDEQEALPPLQPSHIPAVHGSGTSPEVPQVVYDHLTTHTTCCSTLGPLEVNGSSLYRSLRLCFGFPLIFLLMLGA